MKRVSKNNSSVNSAMGEYIDNILAENLTLKRKLDSKCEAISILNSEVERMRMDLTRKKEIIDELKKKQVPLCPEPEVTSSDSTRNLQREINSLRVKLRDALGDVQALRCHANVEREVSSCSEDESGKGGLNSNEMLVEQLEKLQRSKFELECDFQSLLDEKEELITERDAYKCKLHRLNHECNVLLKGDSSNLIDLDALILENRVLQERILQMQEESQRCKEISERYKNLLKNKTHKVGDPNTNTLTSANIGAGLLLTTKQVKEYLENDGAHYAGEASWQDLRSLCVTLLDSLSDKSLAFSHQKRANRILAARIAQLEQQFHSTGIGTSTHRLSLAQSPSTVFIKGNKEFHDDGTAGSEEKRGINSPGAAEEEKTAA